MDNPMPAEVEEDFRVRAHAIVRAWLRDDVEGLVSLTGDDADELLPMVTQILMDALLEVVSRERIERNLDEVREAVGRLDGDLGCSSNRQTHTGTRQGQMAHSRELLSTRRRGRGLPRRNSPGLNVCEVSTGLHLSVG
jgi:hypothetical protein